MLSDTTGLVLALAIPTAELLGIIFAVHAVMRARTSQGAVAWAVALISFPIVTLGLYALFGRSRFHGYVVARRKGNLEIQDIANDLDRRYLPQDRVVFPSDVERYRTLERLAKMPFTQGNSARLLIDGKATFDAIFAAIEAAREYVLVQFFIVRDDRLGRELQRRMIEKAHSGVRVYFLYDGIGSHGLSKGYIGELRAAGVEVAAFNTRRDPRSRFQINFRNHRKIVIADGAHGFVGGLNVGVEYLGEHPRLSPWRDTHLALDGLSVIALQLAFLEDWHWACKGVPTLHWWPPTIAEADQKVLVLPSGPADSRETCTLFFLHSINSARKRVWIVSPYFVPDEAVIAALKLAALRGVDVRVLIPQHPDHRLVHLAAQSYFPIAVANGIKLYRYEEGFLHQKVMLVDDDIASVGTANLDNRSFRLNFEISIVVSDSAFTHDIEAMLERDFSNSHLVTQEDVDRRSWLLHVSSRVARLLSPVL